MSPHLSLNYISYSVVAHPVAPCELPIGHTKCVKSPDVDNSPVRKFSEAVIYALRGALLVRPVSIVVTFRPQEKMARVNALAIVAPMENAQPVRNGSVVENPRYPMSGKAFTASSDPHGESPVITLNRVLVFPALVLLGNPAPKNGGIDISYFDFIAGLCNDLLSFVHKLILYVEVRARSAGSTVAALDYFPSVNPACQVA